MAHVYVVFEDWGGDDMMLGVYTTKANALTRAKNFVKRRWERGDRYFPNEPVIDDFSAGNDDGYDGEYVVYVTADPENENNEIYILECELDNLRT